MSRNLYDRQPVKSIFVKLTPTDIAGGGFTAKLPLGAWITAIVGTVTVAFNTAGTTPTCKITLTDGTNVYINAQSLAATGDLTVAIAKKYLASGGTLTGAITEGVASGSITTATVGEAVLRIDYVQVGEGGIIEG